MKVEVPRGTGESYVAEVKISEDLKESEIVDDLLEEAKKIHMGYYVTYRIVD